MKRILLAPLLSAFVLPGLGQVVNRQFRKAGLLMAAVMVLFLGLVFKLIFDLNKVLLALPLETLEKSPRPLATVAQALSGRDKTVLVGLLVGLLAVWAYSVWDAFTAARKGNGGQP